MPGTAVCIDETLNVGEQLGGTLDFIQNQTVFLREKTPRIFDCPGSHVRCFERAVMIIAKECLNQCGLARLPGTRERDNRVVCGSGFQCVGQVAA